MLCSKDTNKYFVKNFSTIPVSMVNCQFTGGEICRLVYGAHGGGLVRVHVLAQLPPHKLGEDLLDPRHPATTPDQDHLPSQMLIQYITQDIVASDTVTFQSVL